MQITLLKCKLHSARVTHAELRYDGSCAIDADLLDHAGVREHEQIHIYNISNGERLVTYAIRAQAGSGIISVNGAAARKAAPGDELIICAYAAMAEQEARSFRPTLLYLDASNQVARKADQIPMQAL